MMIKMVMMITMMHGRILSPPGKKIGQLVCSWWSCGGGGVGGEGDTDDGDDGDDDDDDAQHILSPPGNKVGQPVLSWALAA